MDEKGKETGTQVKGTGKEHLVRIVVLTDTALRNGVNSPLVSFRRPLRRKPETTLNDFKEKAQKLFHILPQHQRYWRWRSAERCLEASPLTEQDLALPLKDVLKGADKLRLYLESANTPVQKDDILISFEHYDPTLKTAKFVGHIVVQPSLRIADLFPHLNNFINQPLSSPLFVFGRLLHGIPTNHLPPHKSLQQLNIRHNATLTFQQCFELCPSPQV